MKVDLGIVCCLGKTCINNVLHIRSLWLLKEAMQIPLRVIGLKLHLPRVMLSLRRLLKSSRRSCVATIVRQMIISLRIVKQKEARKKEAGMAVVADASPSNSESANIVQDI